MNDWSINSWQEAAVLISMTAAFVGALVALIRGRIDHETAEAAASDRIIRLIETEADKRVQVVRTEFELKIAEMQLAHKQEIEDLKELFERELQEIRDSQHLACDVPGCTGRVVTPKRKRRPARLPE